MATISPERMQSRIEPSPTGPPKDEGARAVHLRRSASRAGDFAAQEAALSPVQRRGDGTAGADVHTVAAHGTKGGGGALPFGERI